MTTKIHFIGGEVLEVDLSSEDTVKALGFDTMTVPGWARLKTKDGDTFVRVDAVAFVEPKRERTGMAHFG
jgi:hypothetical protein